MSFSPTSINECIAIKYGTGPYTKDYGANERSALKYFRLYVSRNNILVKA